jgi:hypothetical protein
MATLLVRRLDEDLVRRLKDRARAHGRSTEAEHREILEDALRRAAPGTGGGLWEKWTRGPKADLDFSGVDQTIRPTPFDDQG